MRRREAATIIDRIKRGLDPIPPKPEPEPTVADLAARCMRAYVNVHCKPKTVNLYRTAIDRHIVPALGAMPVKDVASKDVIALHQRLRDTPSMANHVVSMLSKMFSLAETWDLVPRARNPCKAVSHYREQSRERFLTPEEYRNVGAALRDAEAEGSMWSPAIAAIRLVVLTGCRKSEILTLRWDDVDRTTGELRLRDGKRGPRMAVTADRVSEPSTAISFSTWPSLLNSPSVRNRSRFFSLYFCTERHGLPPSLRRPQASARLTLCHQAPALPEQSLAVFLLNARYPHPAEQRRVAPVVRQQRAHHLPGVDPIRLALLRLPVHQEACGVQHDRLDRHRSVQPARQPEPLVVCLGMRGYNSSRPPEVSLGRGSMSIREVRPVIDVGYP